MHYKCLQFSCDRSITKDTLPFRSCLGYPFMQFSWTFIPCTTDSDSKNCVRFLAIGHTMIHHWTAKYSSSSSMFPVEGISWNFVLLTFHTFDKN
jgi:hypothetical protein